MVAHHAGRTGIEHEASCIGVCAPAVGLRVGEREPCRAIPHGCRCPEGVTLETKAPKDGLQVEFRGARRGHAEHVHHAARRIAPQRTRIGSNDFDGISHGEIDLVERRAAIRLSFGESVDEHADTTRRAGVGAVARASCAVAANDESHVARAITRLGDDTGNALERVFETNATHRAQLGAGDLADGEGRGKDRPRIPCAGDGDQRQGRRVLHRHRLRGGHIRNDGRENGSMQKDFHDAEALGWVDDAATCRGIDPM